jgi:6-phosphogluconolactonase
VPEEGAPRLVVAQDPAGLADEASRLVLTFLEQALVSRGRARVILAGGSTPRRTYRLLAEGISARALPTHAITWYFGDERWVLPDDPQSNERMAREALLEPIAAPESCIGSWSAGSGDPVECAGRYGEALQAGLEGENPDIVLLGIGPDGHTASLFPGAMACLPDGQTVPVARSISRRFHAAAIRGGGAPAGWRLTLCPDFLRTTIHVVFLAAGADKAGPVHRAVDGDVGTPAGWIRGTTTDFIVTRDAASQQE